ncbi:hypothetical protein BDR26DRAFT_853906 [Obelidium mucronatum]|nr:hypothetical protein BDR26DRAFT_853906 [Obelidium mucronatum]
MSAVAVTQNAGGSVTSTLYLSNYYMQGFSAADNTVSVTFTYSQGVICSTTATTVANVACPAGLSGASCLAATCVGPAPSASVISKVYAGFTVCPAASLGCGRNGATASVDGVSLSAATFVVDAGRGESSPPPPPPQVAVPDQPQPPAATAPVSNPANPATPDTPNTPNTPNTNTPASASNASSGSTAPSAAKPIPQAGGATANPASAVPVAALAPADAGRTSPAAFVGGGVAAVVAVLCAVAFVVQHRRSQTRAEVARKRLSPEYPFGKPVNFEDPESIPNPPESPLPMPMPTLTPVIHKDAVLAARAYDHSATPAKFKSIERAPRTSGTLERAAPRAVSVDRSNTLERIPRHHAHQQPAMQPRFPVGGIAATPAATAETVVYPGYYDQQGVYHFFTPEELQAQQAGRH